MKHILVISFILHSTLSVGQQLSEQNWTNTRHQSYAQISGNGGFVSSGFHNSFINELMTKDVLSSEVRVEQLDGLNSFTRIGGDYNYGLSAGLSLKNQNHQLSVWVSDEAHAHGKIPKDLMSLGLFGNKGFAGDTAQIANAELNLTRFQKFGIGWLYSPSEDVSIGLRLSVINAETLFELHTRSTQLFTSALGDTVYADVDAGGQFSDTANIGFGKTNGGGAAVDLVYTQFMGAEDDKWRLDLMVQNLSLVQWSPQSIQIDLDEKISFSGINVGDITQIENQDFDLADSLQMEFEKATRYGTITRLLPGGMQAKISQIKARGIEMEFGGAARWNSGYLPYAWVASRFQFNESVESGASVGYSGYAGLQVGLNAGYIGERINAAIQVQNVDAILFGKTRAGAGIRLSIQYLW